MTTLLLDTEDRGHAEATVSALWPHLRIRGSRSGEAARTRIRRASLGLLHVDDVEIGYDVNFVAAPTDSIHLMCVRAGAVEYARGDGDTDRFGPGQAGGFGGLEGASLTGRMLKARFHLISLNGSALSDASDGDNPVHLIGPDPVSDAANRQLVRVVDYVCTTAVGGNGGARGGIVANAVERLVAATMLASLPTTALLDPVNDRHPQSTPLLLRRAISFIEDHAGDDISLHDIAGSVYVTPRALQYMFRRYRGCTPMEYLRTTRLAHTHRELLAGDRSMTTVGEIARRWGFGHLGRYATSYRQMFGESPHVTLRG